MKRGILLVFCIISALTVCGKAESTEPEIKGWTRVGYFQNEKALSQNSEKG